MKRKLIGLAVALTLPISFSYAVITGVTTGGPLSTTSLSWIAAPVLLATDSNPGAALTINPVVRSNNATGGSYFSVKNFGTSTLNSFTISQIVSSTIVSIQMCSGVWTESSGACSGTITTVLTNTGSAVITITLAPGVSIRLRVNASGVGRSTTITAATSRSDVRSQTIVNS